MVLPSEPMGLFRNRTGASDRIIEGVVSMLKAGELQPAEPMPDASALARRFGGGKRAARSASKVLLDAGILEVRRHGKVYVSLLGADPARLAGLGGRGLTAPSGHATS